MLECMQEPEMNVHRGKRAQVEIMGRGGQVDTRGLRGSKVLGRLSTGTN